VQFFGFFFGREKGEERRKERARREGNNQVFRFVRLGHLLSGFAHCDGSEEKREKGHFEKGGGKKEGGAGSARPGAHCHRYCPSVVVRMRSEIEGREESFQKEEGGGGGEEHTAPVVRSFILLRRRHRSGIQDKEKKKKDLKKKRGRRGGAVARAGPWRSSRRRLCHIDGVRTSSPVKEKRGGRRKFPGGEREDGEGGEGRRTGAGLPIFSLIIFSLSSLCRLASASKKKRNNLKKKGGKGTGCVCPEAYLLRGSRIFCALLPIHN